MCVKVWRLLVTYSSQCRWFVFVPSRVGWMWHGVMLTRVWWLRYGERVSLMPPTQEILSPFILSIGYVGLIGSFSSYRLVMLYLFIGYGCDGERDMCLRLLGYAMCTYLFYFFSAINVVLLFSVVCGLWGTFSPLENISSFICWQLDSMSLLLCWEQHREKRKRATGGKFLFIISREIKMDKAPSARRSINRVSRSRIYKRQADG